MSDDITLNLKAGTRHKIDPKALPYITFKRLKNAGESDQEEVTEDVVLCDSFGSPFVWVDQNWVTQCLQRGWEIVDSGNFDRLRRHDGTYHQQLEDIRQLVASTSSMHKEMADMRAEMDKLKAEREQLLAERASLPALATEGDLRTSEEKEAGIVSVVLEEDAKPKKGK